MVRRPTSWVWGIGRRRVRSGSLVASATAVALLVGCSSSPTDPSADPGAGSGSPNIVFVLTDDLAWNLVQYMPHVQRLQNGRA